MTIIPTMHASHPRRVPPEFNIPEETIYVPDRKICKWLTSGKNYIEIAKKKIEVNKVGKPFALKIISADYNNFNFDVIRAPEVKVSTIENVPGSLYIPEIVRVDDEPKLIANGYLRMTPAMHDFIEQIVKCFNIQTKNFQITLGYQPYEFNMMNKPVAGAIPRPTTHQQPHIPISIENNPMDEEPFVDIKPNPLISSPDILRTHTDDSESFTDDTSSVHLAFRAGDILFASTDEHKVDEYIENNGIVKKSIKLN